MPRSSSLLGALLLIVAPAAGCDGETSSGPGTGANLPPPCPSSGPILVQGKPTGLTLCSDGQISRSEAVACPVQLEGQTQCQATSASSTCNQDADCTERTNGFCGTLDAEGPSCHCRYGCVQDADCSPGQLCRCGQAVGYCVSAGCATDADCGAGRRCAEFGNAQNPCSSRGFACTTDRDTCAGSSCLDDSTSASAAICRPDESGAWACVTESICVSGRPLVVEHGLRLAPLQGAPGWA